MREDDKPLSEAAQSDVIDKQKHYAIICQSTIPLIFRVVVCLSIIFNISLFIWSNSINIATVRAVLDVRDREDDLGNVFEFNLGGTVSDMWTAGTYSLSILLAFFSGAWPYVKLVSMLLALILPPRVLSVPLRDSTLTWLDVLGKWSLLDTFFMVMMMVAFQFDLFVARDVEINVYVRAEWGFYAFLLATMLSLILGHCVLHMHRVVMDKERKMPCMSEIRGGNSWEGEAIMNHTFTVYLQEARSPLTSSLVEAAEPPTVAQSTESERSYLAVNVYVTIAGRVVILLLISACIVSVVLGTLRDTFNFEFRGLTGLLMGDDSVQTYSALSIGADLPAASRVPQDTGIRWLQASYYLFAIAMPLLFLLCSAALWVVPLPLRHARTALLVTDIVNAWNALDVFVIALVACLLQIQQFAKFIVGDSCDELDKILEKYFDGPLNGDDTCFDVVTTLKNDAWLLYFSAGFLAVAGIGLMGINHAAYKEREQRCLAALVVDDINKLKVSTTNGPKVASDECDDVDEAPSKMWISLLAWRRLWLARFLRLIITLRLVKIEPLSAMVK